MMHDCGDNTAALEATSLPLWSPFAGLGAIGIDAGGIIATFNPAALAMLGYASAAQLLGCAFETAILAAGSAEQPQCGSAPPQPYLPERLEVFRRADGSTFPALAQYLRFPYDQPAGSTVVIFAEFSGHAAVAHALHASEELFRAVVETANDAIFVAVDMKFAYVNEAAMRLFRASEPAQLLGQSVFDRIHPDFHELVRQRAESGHAPLVEEIYVALDGALLPVEVSASPIVFRSQKGGVVFARDIAERKQIESRLLTQSMVLDQIADLVTVTDLDGNITYVNVSQCRSMGMERNQLLGRNVAVLGGNPDGDAKREEIRQRTLADATWHGEVTNVTPAGERKHVDLRTSVVRDEAGSPLCLVGLATDITERKRSETKLRLMAQVFNEAQEGIVITDADANVLEVNAAFLRINQYSREELIGRNPRVLQSGRHDNAFYECMWQSIRASGHWRGEIWNRRKDGGIFPQLLTISAMTDESGHVTHYVGISSDISDLKQQSLTLERIAYYDPLTGIPNRLLLEDRLRLALAASQRTGDNLAVCYLDLDGFKPVNDQFGHKVGDVVLKEVASRLVGAVRAEDTVARIGGDEFVLLLGGLKSLADSEFLLHRILTGLALPFDLPAGSVCISGSIGVALFPGDVADPELLITLADKAMYVAKEAGRNRFHIHNPAVEARKRANSMLRRKIEDALRLEQFDLYYQPIVDCRGGAIVGMEALLRWQHPVLGVRLPAEFLPLVESENAIAAVDDWVLRTALQQIQIWDLAGKMIPVSINLSARSLLRPEFESSLGSAVRPYADSIVSRLTIEISEAAALVDITAISGLIRRTRPLGVRYALDNFGVSSSSLGHLKRMSTDALKIDRTIVRDMVNNPDDLAVIYGVIALACAFHQEVVAEGVETIDQLLLLLELGCGVMQGFGICPPMPADQATNWIKSFTPDPRWRSGQYGSISRSDFDLLLLEALHRDWLGEVNKSFMAGDTKDKLGGFSFENCRITEWCNRVGYRRFGSVAEFHALQKQHGELHRLLQDIAARGIPPCASDLLAMNEASRGFIEALRAFRAQNRQPLGPDKSVDFFSGEPKEAL
jgi:diguanylate cyclase (GGDEF)-like protein/PAS domain S-box-containing protein